MYSSQAIETAKELWGGSTWPSVFASPPQHREGPVSSSGRSMPPLDLYQQLRGSLSADDIPSKMDEEGLKDLARAGHWAAVVVLAKRLESRATAEGYRIVEPPLPPALLLTPNPPGSEAAQLATADAREDVRAFLQHLLREPRCLLKDRHLTAPQRQHVARFPYLAARVQALWQMRLYDRTAPLLQDFMKDDMDDGETKEEERLSPSPSATQWFHPVTMGSLVPFSLRLMSATLPYYVQVASKDPNSTNALKGVRLAERRLVDLLDASDKTLEGEIVHLLYTARLFFPSSALQAPYSAGEETSWESLLESEARLLIFQQGHRRRKRVLSTLSYVRYKLRHVSSMFETFQQLLEEEEAGAALNIDGGLPPPLCRGMRARGVDTECFRAQFLFPVGSAVHHAFMLQRLACIGLQLGNGCLSEQVIRALTAYRSEKCTEAQQQHEERLGLFASLLGISLPPSDTAPPESWAHTLSTSSQSLCDSLCVCFELLEKLVLGFQDVTRDAHPRSLARFQRIAELAQERISAVHGERSAQEGGSDSMYYGTPVAQGSEKRTPEWLCAQLLGAMHSEEDLALTAIQTLRSRAQVSHLTSIPYQPISTGESTARTIEQPEALARAMEEAVEAHLLTNPTGLVHSDAFLYAACRCFMFTGNGKKKRSQLVDVMELMVAERSSLRALEEA